MSEWVMHSGNFLLWMLILALAVTALVGGFLGYFMATCQPQTRRRVMRVFWIGLALAPIAGAYIGYRNWADRYRWPIDHIASLQDLPPADKSHWPAPAAWSNETVAVDVATPDGLKPTNITYHINSLGMKLVTIRPGTFWEGLTKAQALRMGGINKFGHQVTLTKSYALGAFEISNKIYEQYDPTFAKRRPAYQHGADGGDHPVEGPTWLEAQKFCRWLSEKEGRLYRLPTEAEWEYACKAGTTTILYWGDESWDRRKANVGGIRSVTESYAEDGYEYTAPIGSFPPNPWGLYDMVGNVWEWVNDWFALYPSEPQTDPAGPATGHMRVDKGAGWDTRTRHIKSCARDGNNPADLFELRGFRVLCEFDGEN